MGLLKTKFSSLLLAFGLAATITVSLSSCGAKKPSPKVEAKSELPNDSQIFLNGKDYKLNSYDYSNVIPTEAYDNPVQDFKITFLEDKYFDGHGSITFPINLNQYFYPVMDDEKLISNGDLIDVKLIAKNDYKFLIDDSSKKSNKLVNVIHVKFNVPNVYQDKDIDPVNVLNDDIHWKKGIEFAFINNPIDNPYHKFGMFTRKDNTTWIMPPYGNWRWNNCKGSYGWKQVILEGNLITKYISGSQLKIVHCSEDGNKIPFMVKDSERWLEYHPTLHVE